MSDSFQAALSQITYILKTSPGAPTVENLLRLASIYKFETFREGIENNLSRISIAGQILVIDIDFEERRSSRNKGQTGFHLHSVKLILANNETGGFKDVNSVNGENVLRNSLTMYPDLAKFDLCLERLAAIDQHSVVEQGALKVDCFGFISDVSDYLLGAFPQGEVIINPTDEFAFEVYGKFKIYLQPNEKLATQLYSFSNSNNDEEIGKFEKSYNNTTTTTATSFNSSHVLDHKEPKIIPDVGFKVEILSGEGLPILKHMIKQYGVIVDDDERQSQDQNQDQDGLTKVTLPDINDTYKAKGEHSQHTTLQLFYLFQSEMVSINGFQCGDIVQVVEAIGALTRLEQMVKVFDVVREKCTLVDRLTDVETETVRLADFLQRADGSGNVDDGSSMDVDRESSTNGFLTINASEDGFEVLGSVVNGVSGERKIEKKVDFADEGFCVKVEELCAMLESEVFV